MKLFDFAEYFGSLGKGFEPPPYINNALDRLQRGEFASFQQLQRHEKRLAMLRQSAFYLETNPGAKMLMACATEKDVDEMRELIERFCPHLDIEFTSLDRPMRGQSLARPPVIDDLEDEEDDEGEEWKR